jgi:hypothetical protein
MAPASNKDFHPAYLIIPLISYPIFPFFFLLIEAIYLSSKDKKRAISDIVLLILTVILPALWFCLVVYGNVHSYKGATG